MTRMKITACALAFALGATVVGARQTVLSRLGVSETHAREIIMSAIQGMFSVGSAAKPFLALAPGARAAAVNDVVAWAKVYFASDTFKQAWAKERAQAKPEQDARGTVDDEIKAKNAEQQKSIDDVKKLLPSMPPDGQKALLETIKQMEATIKDPAQQKLQRDMIVGDRAEHDRRFQEDLKRWQEQYPVDHNVLIAKRLRAFLAMSAYVNFDAKLVVRDGRKVFADQPFEEKSSDWKMCYRAGREATTAARAAATAWLKELGR